MRELVGCDALAGRQGEKLALMVSGKLNPVLRHQELRGLQRHQRAGEAVAQVDNRIRAAAADVFDHGLKRREISMNVGDDGNAHPDFSPTPAATPAPARPSFR
jgi:hypothetical protein